MINICCINNGLERGRDYVEILHDMVTRNIGDEIKGRFVCITDDQRRYAKGIEKVPTNCREEVFGQGELVIFFELTTVIVGGLDDIIAYKGNHAVNADQSVVLYRIGMDDCEPEKMEDLFPGQFGVFDGLVKLDPPKGMRVISFKGFESPHTVTNDWMPHVWKIGGGTIIEYKVAGNVSDELLTENIKHAMTLGHETLEVMAEPHDGVLCICGGGPSLADHIPEIRAQADRGAVIWALNNSFRYLQDHGIEPHAQVMMDAREKNEAFVAENTHAARLYASTCHPKVFEKAFKNGGSILMWHQYIDGILDFLKGIKAALIGCGNSVGLKAMGLSMIMGFRDVHLYGYDSSYRDDKNHAYAQPLNDNERIIEVQVNGRVFKTAPWMAMQAEEFKETAKDLIETHGMKFTIHGDGLLPYVAELLYKPSN